MSLQRDRTSSQVGGARRAGFIATFALLGAALVGAWAGITLNSQMSDVAVIAGFVLISVAVASGAVYAVHRRDKC